MVLVVLAVGWLLFGAALAVLAAVKLHAPGMFAGVGWLTFGRIQPAAWNALVLGFGTFGGLALALWMTARLAGVPLVGGGMIILGAVTWHVGLKLGILGVLLGESRGLEGLELPGYATTILLAGYIGMAAWVLVTLARRVERELYVSLWYLVGAVFSFPWVFAAGYIVPGMFPLRGVLQAANQVWFMQNLQVLWFGFLVLAAVYYLLPKLSGGAPTNRSYALFGFWGLLALGGLGGLVRYMGGPFPAWMPTLAVVANVLILFPLAAVVVSLFEIVRGRMAVVKGSVVLWFVLFAAGCWIVATALGALNSLAVVRRLTHLTLFSVGVDQVLFWGGFGMAVFGALYFAIPRLLGCEWPSGFLARIHFFGAAAAIVLFVGAYLVGGLVHGAALNNPDLPFIDVARRYVPFASTATLANLLLLAGAVAFGINLVRLLLRQLRTGCAPVAAAMFKPLPVEVDA